MIAELSGGTTSFQYAGVAQLDRVTGYEPVGRGFESLHPYHVGASVLSLAPTFFDRQSTLILLPLFLKDDPSKSIQTISAAYGLPVTRRSVGGVLFSHTVLWAPSAYGPWAVNTASGSAGLTAPGGIGGDETAPDTLKFGPLSRDLPDHDKKGIPAISHLEVYIPQQA